MRIWRRFDCGTLQERSMPVLSLRISGKYT